MGAEVGKVCVKSSSPFVLDWEIPDFFSRLQRFEYYNSPVFLFCNQSWKLRIQKFSNTSEFTKLSLDSHEKKHQTHHISYKISIINADGRTFGYIEGQAHSKKFLRTLCPLPQITELLQNQEEIALGGTWTISCVFQCTCHLEKSRSITAVEDSERLLQDMEALLLTGKGSDVTLIVQDRKFAVHRLILGARSSVFESMFSHDVVETTNGVVNIPDFDPDVFQDFLLYLYSAKVEMLSLEKVISLYSAADKYDSQELKAKCIEYMRDNLSVDMFYSVISLALQHQESSLLEASTEFFVKNLKQIIATVGWQEFLKENPTAANELLIKASGFYVPPKEKK